LELDAPGCTFFFPRFPQSSFPTQEHPLAVDVAFQPRTGESSSAATAQEALDLNSRVRGPPQPENDMQM
jgi:hypothetical protein